MKKIQIKHILITTLIILSTININAQSKPNIKRYNKDYSLVLNSYFVDIHRKSVKYDTLSAYVYRRGVLYDKLQLSYDSMKLVFSTQLDLEEKNSQKLLNLTKELKVTNNNLISKTHLILDDYEKEVKKNKLLKKVVGGAIGISLAIFFLK